MEKKRAIARVIGAKPRDAMLYGCGILLTAAAESCFYGCGIWLWRFRERERERNQFLWPLREREIKDKEMKKRE